MTSGRQRGMLGQGSAGEVLERPSEETQSTSVSPAEVKPLPLAERRIVRIGWLVAGWFCVAVAIVGLALPGLPTTGPLILALACFARGSESLHSWLLNHRFLGPPLQRWEAQRIIPLRAKVVAVSMMIGSLAYVIFVASLRMWALVLVCVLVAVGMIVVLRLPHTLPVREPDE